MSSSGSFLESVWSFLSNNQMLVMVVLFMAYVCSPVQWLFVNRYARTCLTCACGSM
jgi:hypothetical protein